MRVMVVGTGAREHALAWSVARSQGVETVFAAPGNPGTAGEGTKVCNVQWDMADFDALAGFAEAEHVDLTIVGPDALVAAGIRDFFDRRGLDCFAPTSEAAQLESSKSFAKAFMARHGIPTAGYRTFSDSVVAEDYIRAHGAPIVVKADGLTGGKGVVVAQSVEEAVSAARSMLSGDRFGDAGRQIVVEEFLIGEEASFTCVVDGHQAVPLASSQDHKTRDDGDRGPNTGGMGAYSPAPVVTDEVHHRIMSEIVTPTVRGMAEDGAPYQGFLYVGLMIGSDGSPRVVEYNCRFGDPEAQAVLPRLRSNLAELCKQALRGDASGVPVEWDSRAALCVVLAAGGYPLEYARGDRITGLDEELADTKVFHAGTRAVGNQIVTDGGRVLSVVGLGSDIADARDQAYARVEQVHWEAMHYRGDIGFRALARVDGRDR